MSKEDVIELGGVVEDILPGSKFEVLLDNGCSVIATISGRMRMNNIKLVPGDNVMAQISPYDLSKGRIVYRGKKQDKVKEEEE